jgi:hypothetical protein
MTLTNLSMHILLSNMEKKLSNYKAASVGGAKIYIAGQII